MTRACLLTLIISVLTSLATSKQLEQIFGQDDDLQPYSWEYIELTVLSNVALQPEGTTDKLPEFHVISVLFTETNATYILHLTRAQGLFNPEQLTMSDEDDKTDFQCVYEGIVNKVIPNGVHVTGGTLSLSSCDHQEYSGFEGLLLLHDHHYYIKPDVIRINDNNTNIDPSPTSLDDGASDTQAIKHSHKPSVKHKAYKISNSTQKRPYSRDLDETLRVPPEELQKWAQNQNTNYDNLTDEESTTLGSVWSANIRKKFHSRMKIVKSPTNTTNSQKVVEIAVFTDAKLYNKWKSRFPKNTTGKVRQFILAVVNNMNALYNQPSMTEKISFRLVNIEIATTQPINLNDNNGQAVNFLTSFCAYAAEKNLQGTLWDHALLLTGVDLNENGNNITAGIAWHSTMCVNGLSCSVVEGTAFSSAFVSSHEVGHSLGMEHDGSKLNADCNANTYIMSPTTGGGKTSWSKCSMRNSKEFLGKGYLGTNPPKCLTKKSSKVGGEINFSSGKLPGQQFQAKIQCSSFCGSKCTPYVTRKAPYNNICNLLHCQQKQGQFTIVESIHPALEGTPCAKGKICRLGKCQKQ